MEREGLIHKCGGKVWIATNDFLTLALGWEIHVTLYSSCSKLIIDTLKNNYLKDTGISIVFLPLTGEIRYLYFQDFHFVEQKRKS